jgi:hypothetical protein
MNRFTSLLRDIRDRLDLPQPAKSRILLEISADLEDLYQAYRQKGLESAEAERRAIETLNLSPESLNQLIQVHQSPLRRLYYRLSEKTLNRWERGIFILILLVMITASARVTLTTPFFRTANLLVWPVLIIFTGILGISLAKFYQLYIRKDHRIHGLRKGLALILGLGLLNVWIALTGYIIGIYHNGSQYMFTGLLSPVLGTAQQYSEMSRMGAQWLVETSAMLIVCLVTALVTAMIWFLFLSRVKRIEYAEASVLLQEKKNPEE